MMSRIPPSPGPAQGTRVGIPHSKSVPLRLAALLLLFSAGAFAAEPDKPPTAGDTEKNIPLPPVFPEGQSQSQAEPADQAAAAKTVGEEAIKPMLFANYYTWYSTHTGPNKTWTHWMRHPVAAAMAEEAKRTGKAVEKLDPKDNASVFWPLAGPYDSTDKEIVRWHIRLAKAAGIDAFLVDWWGPNNWGLVPGLTRIAFEEAVLPVAAEENFKVALLDETVQFTPPGHSKEWAATYLKKYKDHPSYLKIDGKPVYYLYQVAFDPSLTPAKFAELKSFVEVRVGPVYWMVEAIANPNGDFRIPIEWRPVDGVDSFSFYGTFSIFPAHTYEELAARYAKVVEQAHGSGKRMCVPVHPGHDNRNEGNPKHYEMPRRDGQAFRDYLRAASDSKADYVMVTSFNEWPESTVIEPSSSWEDPYQYLKILAEWKGVEFKAPEEPQRVKTAAAAGMPGDGGKAGIGNRPEEGQEQ